MTLQRATPQTSRHTEVELSARPRAAAIARRAVRQFLGPRRLPARVIDDAQLIASELVTNALRYGGLRIGLDLAVTGRVLTLAVADGSPVTPQLRAGADLDQRGRGLPIVSALAATWGVLEVDRGK